MHKVVRIMFLSASIAVSGCVVGTDGAPLVGHDPGRQTYQRLTSGPGGFQLVRESRPGVTEEVVLRRSVDCRTVLGFARDDGGFLMAVIGDEHVPLAEGRYQWQAASGR